MADPTSTSVGQRLNRRVVLAGATASIALAANGAPAFAAAYEDDGDQAAAIKHIAQGRPIKSGRVKLTLPELAENGATLAAIIDRLMTEFDVERGQLESDVRRLAAELIAAGLLELGPEA